MGCSGSKTEPAKNIVHKTSAAGKKASQCVKDTAVCGFKEGEKLGASAVDKTKGATEDVLHKTKDLGGDVLDKTKDVGSATVEKTKGLTGDAVSGASTAQEKVRDETQKVVDGTTQKLQAGADSMKQTGAGMTNAVTEKM